jgi:hypothetical protein
MESNLTAMQDLRQDLLDTILTGSDALNEIKDEQIRNAAKNLFETTINTIISRIDDELLEMEKQQKDDFAIEFSEWCLNSLLNGEEPKAETMKELLEIFKNK